MGPDRVRCVGGGRRGLAALCYAEFASTLPVAGSAYTFSYATFGEVIAWIIGHRAAKTCRR